MGQKTPRWKHIESKRDSKRLHYSRFVLSPLRKGRADTIGLAIRRVLLGEIEGTRITRAKLENALHEYSTIFGIEESVHEIFMNLGKIVLRSDVHGIRNAYICARGPGCVTARDILLPPSVGIVDAAQHIASLTKPIDLRIELQIERGCGYRMRTPKNDKDGSYPIDTVFTPVRNVNYSIHSYGNEKQEILFLEIWTNGSLTPGEALYEASRNLMNFFIPFIDVEEQDLSLNPEYNQNEFRGVSHFVTPNFFAFSDIFHNLVKRDQKMALNWIFIDQLALTRRLYNSLKRYNIHTLWGLLNLTQKDLVIRKIEPRVGDVKRILDFLEKHSLIDEPTNGFWF